MAEQSTPPSGLMKNGTKSGDGGYDASAITVLNPGGPRFRTGPKRVLGRGERDTFR